MLCSRPEWSRTEVNKIWPASKKIKPSVPALKGDSRPQADPWYSYQRQILSKILGSGVTTSVGSGQADKMRLSRRLPRERGEEAKASLPR